MITTRDINVDLSRGKRPLQQKTTKEVDVYVKQGKPKPTKIAVSTHNIEDVADIAEKARRDKIVKQRKDFRKGDTVYKNEKGELKTEGQLKEDSKKLANKEKMAKVRAAKGKKK